MTLDTDLVSLGDESFAARRYYDALTAYQTAYRRDKIVEMAEALLSRCSFSGAWKHKLSGVPAVQGAGILLPFCLVLALLDCFFCNSKLKVIKLCYATALEMK